MKKLILAPAFFITAISSFSQTILTNEKTKDYYLTKSRHQKTTAWIMLGGGVALTGVGLAVSQSNTIDYAMGNSSNHNTAGSVLAVVGVASMLGSIPLFISAAHNKHRAAEVAFNMQKIPLLSAVPNRTVLFQPAVTLKIPL